MTISKGIAFIILSSFVCFLLAVTTDMSHQELGALANFIWPPVLGIIAIIIFLLVSWITKSYSSRLIVLVFCCSYLLYVGIALHLGRDEWPLVTF